MKLSQLLSTALLLTTSFAHAADAPLYQLSVNGERVENGKILNMTFQEISREADHSIAEVTFVSGGSVSSSMFALRGACGVARVRGEKFFKVVPLSKNPSRIRLQFQAQASEVELRPAVIADKVFSVSECAMIGF
jgi:hypothetical protein